MSNPRSTRSRSTRSPDPKKSLKNQTALAQEERKVSTKRPPKEEPTTSIETKSKGKTIEEKNTRSSGSSSRIRSSESQASKESLSRNSQEPPSKSPEDEEPPPRSSEDEEPPPKSLKNNRNPFSSDGAVSISSLNEDPLNDISKEFKESKNPFANVKDIFPLGPPMNARKRVFERQPAQKSMKRSKK